MRKSPSGKETGRKRLGLKDRLSLSFLALCIGITVLVGGAGLFFGVISQNSYILAQQRLVAHRASEEVSDYIAEKVGILKTAIWMVDMAENDPVAIRDNVNGIMGISGDFRQVALLDESGKVVGYASRVSNALSDNLLALLSGAENAVRENDVYFSPSYIDEGSGEPMVVVASAVKDVFGRFRGTLMAEISIKFMWDLVGGMRVGEGGLAYVTDRKGFLLAFPDSGRVLKGGDVSGLEVMEAYRQGDLLSDGGYAAISRGIDGTLAVVTLVSVGLPGWVVITELPFWEAYAILVQEVVLFVVFILLLYVLFVAVSRYLSRRLSLPIVNLRDAATEIGQGNLTKKIAVDSHDEIGDLARSFNEMTGRLKDLYDNLEAKVEERTRELEAHRVEFISIATHQLKTPITALKWNTEALAENAAELGPNSRELVGDIVKIISGMSNLVNALLNVSRLDLGTCAVIPEPLSLKESLQSVIGLLQPEIERKRLDLAVSVGVDVPGSYDADPQLLDIIFQNLLSNAVKYTPDGGKIDVSLSMSDLSVVFRVSDSGIGIPKDQQDRIFTRMFRADNSVSAEGTGLGLYMVKRILENIGGRIEFVSREGEGTVFTVTLPEKGMPARAGTRRLS
ncbi:sensor histidine kinase [Candidatus Uhrbacteria bacterium]|nr:sensor histidine kinase [Candidatus Uhrbacteria bacterium]